MSKLTLSTIIFVCGLLLLLLCSATFTSAQDTALPSDARVINVKAAPFNAAGDGMTDDTAAIQAAIKKAIDSNLRYSAPTFVYLPKGTYKISNQLENRISTGGWSSGWRAGMILYGESRRETVLQLADYAAGYADKIVPKAVIKTGSEDPKSDGGGNQAFRHSIFNLTIDVGLGNPGAVGVDYVANNRGSIKNVTVRARGEALTGISLRREWPGPALIKNVSIEGFDYAVNTGHYQYSMTFEHLSLSGQKIAGIRNPNNVLNIRRLTSNNSVPVINASGSGSHVTLIDSSLSGGAGAAAGTAAIINKGKLFVRNVTSSGYATVIDNQTGTNQDVPGGATPVTVDEFTSHQAVSLFETQPRSLSLPIEETPEFHTNNFSQWANVEALGATPGNSSDDDAAAIQAAIDVGKSVVYLPNGFYHVGRPIIIRGAVRKIVGMSASISKKSDFVGDALIRFEGGNAESVILETLDLNGIIEHASSKALALKHVDHSGYRSTAESTGKLFIEDVIGKPYRINGRQKVWARQLNAEFGSEPLIENNGGTLWILGLKTEGRLTAIKTVGGTTELLGAFIYPLGNVAAEIPAFINDEGRVSLSYVINEQNYAVHVRERRDGVWRELTPSAVPGRGYGSDVALYVGYKASAAPVTLNASADAYVRDGRYAETNYGSTSQLIVKQDTDNGFNREAFVKFDTASISGTVTNARLRFSARLLNTTSNNFLLALAGSSTNWSESAVTWTSKPSLNPTIAAIAVSGTSEQWYEVDVTEHVRAERALGRNSISFALAGAEDGGGNYVLINSREAAANQPQLIVSQ